jgi:hypothetical protein
MMQVSIAQVRIMEQKVRGFSAHTGVNIIAPKGDADLRLKVHHVTYEIEPNGSWVARNEQGLELGRSY